MNKRLQQFLRAPITFKIALIFNLGFLLVPLGVFIRALFGGYNNGSGDDPSSIVVVLILFFLWAPALCISLVLLKFSENINLKSKIISLFSVIYGAVVSWYFVSLLVLGLR